MKEVRVPAHNEGDKEKCRRIEGGKVRKTLHFIVGNSIYLLWLTLVVVCYWLATYHTDLLTALTMDPIVGGVR